jgi:hypothetical protein
MRLSTTIALSACFTLLAACGSSSSNDPGVSDNGNIATQPTVLDCSVDSAACNTANQQASQVGVGQNYGYQNNGTNYGNGGYYGENGALCGCQPGEEPVVFNDISSGYSRPVLRCLRTTQRSYSVNTFSMRYKKRPGQDGKTFVDTSFDRIDERFDTVTQPGANNCYQAAIVTCNPYAQNSCHGVGQHVGCSQVQGHNYGTCQDLSYGSTTTFFN